MSYLPNYKIYYLSDSKNPNEIRYIGLTKLSLDKRLYFHIKNVNYGNSHKNNWIKNILNSGYEVYIELLEQKLTEQEARDKEIFYIKEYNKKGYKLVNGTFGGDGNSNISEETRKKISTSCKESFKYRIPYNKGKTLEELHGNKKAEMLKKKSSEEQKGKKLSEEHIKKIKENNSKYWLGKTKNKSHIDKFVESFKKTARTKEYKERRSEISSKPIIQLDRLGNIIKEWPSIKSAAEFIGINRSGIGECCSGKRKTAGGFLWNYKN